MTESPADDDRLGELEERWQSDPASGVFLQLAEAYRRRGDVERALEVLDDGLDEHPRHLSARVARARCLIDAARLTAAREVLDGVLEQDPTHAVASTLLAEVCLRVGDEPGVREALERCRMLGVDAEQLERLEGMLERVHAGEESSDRGGSVPPAGGAGQRRPGDGGALGRRTVTSASEREAPPFELTERESVDIDLPWMRAPEPRTLRGGADVPFPSLEGTTASVARPDAADVFPLLVAAEPEPPEPVPHVTTEPAPSSTAGPPSEPVPESVPVESELPPSSRTTGVEESPATATLGQLYLRQGHFDEAEAIFERVLSRDPADEVARLGLRSVAARRAEPLEAAELLGDAVPEAGVGMTGRKIALLRRYLERLQG